MFSLEFIEKSFICLLENFVIAGQPWFENFMKTLKNFMKTFLKY